MKILVVGNVLKDVYLNLDSRTENFEVDKNNTKWLDLSFDASEHRFFSRASSLGGAAISLEVLEKMGLKTEINGSSLSLGEDDLTSEFSAEIFRYILVSEGQVSYLVPSALKVTEFVVPEEKFDYLFIDRSAELNEDIAKRISAYLEASPKMKMVVYLRNTDNANSNNLARRADLVFCEKGVELEGVAREKSIFLSEKGLEYLGIKENISIERVDVLTHLSAYSIAAATILGSFILGKTVEKSLKLARANLENATLDSVLTLEELERVAEGLKDEDNLELVAANLLIRGKGILAADESGGSIKKKFGQLEIPDTYENRRDYRNIFFSTPDLEKYVNGVILFEETTEQKADNGQNFVDYLISRQIMPGIKVDKGLEKFEGSEETYTLGLEGLEERLKGYYLKGLRFAKWRSAFLVQLSETGEILTPTDFVIEENCRILAEYAVKCQLAGLVPIVEPEVVYDGNYPIEKCFEATAKVLDCLFKKLREAKVNLSACILKVNMILAGKQYEKQSMPEEVGKETARMLKGHVPEELAGVVFLSGGQTPEQATENLREVIKNGPFPFPVTFSFARALQDPALYAWKGDNANFEEARKAFLERLKENAEVLV